MSKTITKPPQVTVTRAFALQNAVNRAVNGLFNPALLSIAQQPLPAQQPAQPAPVQATVAVEATPEQAGITDPTFTRHEQGEYEKREPLDPPAPDLDAMKKDALLALAGERKVEVKKSWTKAKIIEALRSAP